MANRFDPGDYQVLIRKVQEDGEVLHEARVVELPDVAIYESSAAGAYRAVMSVISALHEAAVDDKRAFPRPLSSRPEAAFNGRVTVRFSKSDHARLAHCADEEGVSLNALITTTCARMLGEREARTAAAPAVGANTPQQRATADAFKVIENARTTSSSSSKKLYETGTGMRGTGTALQGS